MNAISPELQALWATRSYIAVDLYIVTLIDGTVYRWSGGDADILDDGQVYSCGGRTGPFWGLVGDQAQCTWTLGTDTQTLALSVLPGAATIKGLSFARAVAWGLFDGATVEYRRAGLPLTTTARFWPLPATGSAWKFTGTIGDISPAGGSVITFSVNNLGEKLQQPWPRECWQTGCLNMVGNGSCGIDMAEWQVTTAAGAGSTSAAITVATTEADGWFTQGDVTFTSGVLAGMSRTIRGHAGGVLTLMIPFPEDPAQGDAITLNPGCDCTMDAGGCPKYANIAKFRGHPFVPPPSTAD